MGAAFAVGLRRHRAAAAEPFKIPFIGPLSGPIGIVGMPALIGAQFTVEEINRAGGIAGRPLELVVRDTQGKPDLCAAATQELTGEGARLLIAGLSTPEGLAAMPIVKAANAVQVLLAGSGMAFTHESYSRNTFRNSDNDYQRTGGLARLAMEKFPDVAKWGLIVWDGASFVNSAVMFQDLITKHQAGRGRNVQFTDIIKVKFGTTDARPHIARLISEQVDGIYQMVGGTDCATLWQQGAAFGLGKNLKCVVDQTIDFGVAGALKQNLPPNLWGVTMWYEGLHRDVPEGARLVKYYAEKTKMSMTPGYAHYGAFAVSTVAAALRATQGSVDADTIIKVLESGLKIPSIKGEQYYRREDHQLIGPVDYVNTIPSDKEPGFAVGGMIAFPGEELAEPPTPGVAFKV